MNRAAGLADRVYRAILQQHLIVQVSIRSTRSDFAIDRSFATPRRTSATVANSVESANR